MNIQRLRLRERERVGRSRLLLEGKGGRDSGAGSAFKNRFHHQAVLRWNTWESQQKLSAGALFWSERWIFTFGWVRWKPFFEKLLKDDRLTFNVWGWKQLQRYWLAFLFHITAFPAGAFIPNPSISAAENLIYEGCRLQQQQTCTRYEITPWENYSLFSIIKTNYFDKHFRPRLQIPTSIYVWNNQDEFFCIAQMKPQSAQFITVSPRSSKNQ